MSDNAPVTPNPPVPADVTRFAVIQTGGVTTDASIFPYTDADAKRKPAILFIHDDEAKAKARMRSIQRRMDAVKSFDNPSFVTMTPILGVVKVIMRGIAEGSKRGRKPAAAANGTVPANNQDKNLNRPRVHQSTPQKA